MINRIIDVNLNRSMESLRIIEDIIRFYFNQKTETLKIKNFRHKIINHFKSCNLLPFRDTKKDAGKFLNTSDEFKRESIVEVIQTNCKRLQESSRSLEEFLKLNDKKGAGLFKQLRFFIYDLEKEIILTVKKNFDLCLYIIINTEFIRIKDIEQTVKDVIPGGATIIQLKADNLDNRTFVNTARKIKKITKQFNIPFIINNRIDIAVISDADGIHISEKHLTPALIRNKFFYDKIIGYSAVNKKEIDTGIRYKADYIGLEADHSMKAKNQKSKLTRLKQLCKKCDKIVPVVIMEDLDSDDIKACLQCGIKNFALTSAVLIPGNAKKIASQFKKIISKKGENK